MQAPPAPPPAPVQQQQPDPWLVKGAALTPLQREAVDWMTSREQNPKERGGLYTDDMGFGKTLGSLYLACSSKVDGPTLVICPLSLVQVWLNENKKLLRPGVLRMHVYDSTKSPLPARLGERDVVICAHSRLGPDIKKYLSTPAPGREEKTLADELLYEKSFRRGDRYNLYQREPYKHALDDSTMTIERPLAQEGLYSVHWGRIVFDEAHKGKNSEAQVWKAAMCLAANCRWWVTGTPLQNVMRDITNAMLFVRQPDVCREVGTAPAKQYRKDPEMTDQDWRADQAMHKWSFGRNQQELLENRKDILESSPQLRYLVHNTKRVFERAVHFRHPEERHAHALAVARLRRVAQLLAARSEAAPETLYAAPVNSKKRKASLSQPDVAASVAQQLMPHDDAQVKAEVARLIAEGKRETDVLLTYYTKARQICVDLTLAGEPPLPNGAWSTKMQEMLEDIQALPKGTCFLVFGPWVQALEIAGRALNSIKVPNRIMHGGLHVDERNKLVEDFQKPDSHIQALLIQINLGGVGLTLTRATRVLFLTCEFNPGTEDQASMRIWRPGQTQDVVIKRLIIAGSVEELVLETSSKKRKLADSVRETAANKPFSNAVELKHDLDRLWSGKYQERDQERDFHTGVSKRALFESAPTADSVFLGAFEAYAATRSIPKRSLLWRLATSNRDANTRFLRKTAGATPDILSVSLDPLGLRNSLRDDFFAGMKQFSTKIWEDARDGVPRETWSNREVLLQEAKDQQQRTGRINIHPRGAHTPKDYLDLTQQLECPKLVVHLTPELISVDQGQLIGSVNARSVTGEQGRVRGKLATQLRDMAPFCGVSLNVYVLAAYTPFLQHAETHKDEKGFDLPNPHNSMPSPADVYSKTTLDPESLWIQPPVPTPPSSPGGSESGTQIQVEDRSDSTDFLKDVQELLLPLAMQLNGKADDQGILTSLFCMLLITAVPKPKPNLYRVLFVARSGSRVLGVASAILAGEVDRHSALWVPSVHASTSEVRELLLHALLHRLFGQQDKCIFVPMMPPKHKGKGWWCHAPSTQRDIIEPMMRLQHVKFQEFPRPPAAVLSNVKWHVQSGMYAEGELSWSAT
jgi:hypothetical protein